MSSVNSAGGRQWCRLRHILDSKTLLCLIPHRGVQAFSSGITPPPGRIGLGTMFYTTYCFYIGTHSALEIFQILDSTKSKHYLIVIYTVYLLTIYREIL